MGEERLLLLEPRTPGIPVRFPSTHPLIGPHALRKCPRQPGADAESVRFLTALLDCALAVRGTTASSAMPGFCSLACGSMTVPSFPTLFPASFSQHDLHVRLLVPARPTQESGTPATHDRRHANGRGRDRALKPRGPFLSPIAPCPTGSGLAMRAFRNLECLAAACDITLLVIPTGLRSAPPAETSRLCPSVIVLPVRPGKIPCWPCAWYIQTSGEIRVGPPLAV